MDNNKLKKGCAIVVAAYVILAICFFFICGEQLHSRNDVTDMLTPFATIGEITSDTVVVQQIRPTGELLTGVTLQGENYARSNTGSLVVEILRGDELLDRAEVNIQELEENAPVYIPLEIPINGTDYLTLRITAPESTPGNAVTLYYGNSRSATRAQIKADLGEEDLVQVNGEKLDGALCLSMNTRTKLLFGAYYWYFAGAGLMLLCLYSGFLIKRNARGQTTEGLKLVNAFSRYRFLMKQLVARDFKTKYKRSVLGVLWSFLNPLLTMTVQYIVFSTLFRSNIPNFALYLLIGIVCFSFFSEATTMTLSSIVGNASLITKVYVPKYIYSVTRVMSSAVNFLLSLIPLFLVVFITRTPIRASFLLLPLGIICLFMLCLGVGMLLATSMVFFRDTQFLWGVVSMLWMYATPIFYPESILPAKLIPLFKCNPLYHIIRFIRTVLMDGVSPEPKAYALMLLASLIPLVIGVWVFKKNQDKFVLYL